MFKVIKDLTNRHLAAIHRKFPKIFAFVDVASSVYFVVVSIISEEKATEALSRIGLKDEVSGKISGIFYSLTFILFVTLLMGVTKYFALLRRSEQKQLRDALDACEAAKEQMGETLDSLTPNLQSIYEAILQSMLRKIGLESNPGVRITMYLLSSNKISFHPVGRYSHHATYRMQGRTLLPVNEGCIGKAWNDGKHEWRNLAKDLNQRRQKSKSTYGIPNATFDGFSMPTLSIGAYRIDNERMSPVGVIVIEADDHKMIDFDQFEKNFKEEKQSLERLIRATQPFLIDPALALEAEV